MAVFEGGHEEVPKTRVSGGGVLPLPDFTRQLTRFQGNDCRLVSWQLEDVSESQVQ